MPLELGAKQAAWPIVITVLCRWVCLGTWHPFSYLAGFRALCRPSPDEGSGVSGTDRGNV